MTNLIPFFLGAAVGSFICVVADRYKENLFIWDKKIIGGRSHCEFCDKKLQWFELIPIISFLSQKGRCHSCKHKLRLRYLYVEIISGLIFIFVPAVISQNFYQLPTANYVLSALWILVFSLLLLISLIDIRLKIIPDEATAIIAILGILITKIQPFGDFSGSFLGHYAFLFGWRANPWLNHLLAAMLAGVFFTALIFITRGKGMGGGDMKLAAAMGMVFGWPDVVIIVMLSFVIGSIFGIAAIFLKKEKLKSHVAFGPFIALAGALVFLFGYTMIDSYFKLLLG